MATRATTARGAAGPPAGELPGAPWFRLAIYRDIPRWTHRDWFRAIACRLHIAVQLPPAPAIASPEVFQRVESHWRCIANDPIAGSGQYYQATRRTESLGLGPNEAGSGVAVGKLDEATVKDLRNRLWDPNFLLVAVDLGASDEDIKAAFNQLLKLRRSGKPLRRAMTDASIKHWTACHVVPFLDIDLYKRASGVAIRLVDIHQALFGGHAQYYEGRDPKNILDQSTKMYADRLMDPKYFERIDAQFRTLASR